MDPLWVPRLTPGKCQNPLKTRKIDGFPENRSRSDFLAVRRLFWTKSAKSCCFGRKSTKSCCFGLDPGNPAGVQKSVQKSVPTSVFRPLKFWSGSRKVGKKCVSEVPRKVAPNRHFPTKWSIFVFREIRESQKNRQKSTVSWGFVHYFWKIGPPFGRSFAKCFAVISGLYRTGGWILGPTMGPTWILG